MVGSKVAFVVEEGSRKWGIIGDITECILCFHAKPSRAAVMWWLKGLCCIHKRDLLECVDHDCLSHLVELCWQAK
jgi:hypothetical protein